ncbi:MAG: hypothetical protein IT307_17570 [Chloroflexi bacterium]|nr:hypothetical protein [Chloroflexota bacterium]
MARWLDGLEGLAGGVSATPRLVAQPDDTQRAIAPVQVRDDLAAARGVVGQEGQPRGLPRDDLVVRPEREWVRAWRIISELAMS